jgi:hypothetical protein
MANINVSLQTAVFRAPKKIEALIDAAIEVLDGICPWSAADSSESNAGGSLELLVNSIRRDEGGIVMSASVIRPNGSVAQVSLSKTQRVGG